MSLHVKADGTWHEIGEGGGGGGGGFSWAKVSGGTVTTYTKPTGEVMSVHTFTANGTLIVEEPGIAEVLVVAHGGFGQTNSVTGGAGGGGGAKDQLLLLPVGSHPVTLSESLHTNNAIDPVTTPTTIGDLIRVNGAVPSGMGSRAGGGGQGGIATNQGQGGGAGGGAATGAFEENEDRTVPGRGVVSTITGEAVEYGRGGLGGPQANSQRASGPPGTGGNAVTWEIAGGNIGVPGIAVVAVRIG